MTMTLTRSTFLKMWVIQTVVFLIVYSNIPRLMGKSGDKTGNANQIVTIEGNKKFIDI